MKIKTSTIMWLTAGIIGSWFMGITAVSLGLGSLFPAINLVAQPFVCPGGQMVNHSQNYQVSPVENVTTLTWDCVDSHSGAQTELNPWTINVYAGSFYGLLIMAAALIVFYSYRRWGSSQATEKVKKRLAWIQGISVLVIVVGVTLLNLLPVIRPLGAAPAATTLADATAASLESTYAALTLGRISDFSSTAQPLAAWNGIPILPEAVAGQQVNPGAYAFKVPVAAGTMDTILSDYRDRLTPLGWTLADSRWAGMKFTKDTRVLLVTLEPVADTESWIVTLVYVP